MSDNNLLDEEALQHARKLVESIESGDSDSAQRVMDDLASIRESDLFREMGKLTRELHDSLNSFKMDSRIAELAEDEIPDAKERLNYVITMTEQAADKTLTAVEESLPLSDNLKSKSDELATRWVKFRNRELSAEEFRDLATELDGFFGEVSQGAEALSVKLSDVLMAQDFQDLTGQIIRKVITLVHDVEEGLVGLIKMSGKVQAENQQQANEPTTEEKDIKAEGPAIPGVTKAEVVSGQDEVDDLLSSLGF
jgi:chemotaxis protein CheZ